MRLLRMRLGIVMMVLKYWMCKNFLTRHKFFLAVYEFLCYVYLSHETHNYGLIPLCLNKKMPSNPKLVIGTRKRRSNAD